MVKTIPERIKAACLVRSSVGMTQKQAGEILGYGGIAQRAVTRRELGIQPVPMGKLRKLSAPLRCR